MTPKNQSWIDRAQTAPPATEPKPLPITLAVTGFIASLPEAGGPPAGKALCALALNLASRLDRMTANREAAPVAKELRETLKALTPEERDDDPLAGVDLSTPVVDPPPPKPRNVRAKGGRSRKADGDAPDAVAAASSGRGARGGPADGKVGVPRGRANSPKAKR